MAAQLQNSPFEEARKLSLMDFFEQQTGAKPVRRSSKDVQYSFCPKCGQSSKNSTKFSISNDAVFHCFSCQESGDIIHLGELFWNCSSLDSARRLTGKTANGGSTVPTLARAATPAMDDAAEKERAEALRQSISIIGQVAMEWAAKGDTRPHLHYLQGRGFTDSTLATARERQCIGFLPVDSRELTDLLSTEIGRPLLEKAGLWKSDKKMPGIINRPLVLFLPGLNSAEFCLIQKPHGNYAKRIRYGSTPYPYFWPGTNPHSDAVGITEGFFDLLALSQINPQHDILGIPGAGAWNEALFASYHACQTHPKTFHIWLDGDSAGRSGASNIASTLQRLGIHYKVHELPEGMDVNDYLLSQQRAQQR